MQKKTMGYITLLVVVVVVAAGAFLVLRDEGKTTSSDPSTGTYRVALLVNGPIDSSGWNSVGQAGVELIKNELGVQITYSENVAEADYESTFRQYAQEGYDFIVGHGDEFVPAANVVAKEFPNTKFAVIGDYGNNNTNLGVLAFRAGEMGYLLGTVAAVKSETNKIAYIGGQDLPVMEELATLYEQGAKAYKPDIEVSVQWVGDWNDPDHAKEIAQGFIDQGFDVLAVNAGWAVAFRPR
jgi:basic membrane protein A